MSEIKEISRRTYYHEDGFETGPAASVAIIAEIVVETAGKPVYLYGEWIDIADAYGYDVTMESLFDASKKMMDASSDEEQQKYSEEMNRIRRNEVEDRSPFLPFLDEVEQMLHDEMRAHGLAYFFEDEEDEV